MLLGSALPLADSVLQSSDKESIGPPGLAVVGQVLKLLVPDDVETGKPAYLLLLKALHHTATQTQALDVVRTMLHWSLS